MDTTTILILAMIGLSAGILSGLVGLGGGLVVIPAMVYFLGVDQRMAQGTSLALMLPPIGILAAYNYYKAGHINVKYAVIIAAAFFIGGYFGSRLSLSLPEATVKKVFAGVMIVTALKMIIGK